MPSPRYERLPTTTITTDGDYSSSPSSPLSSPSSPLYDIEDARSSHTSPSLIPTEHHRHFDWPNNNMSSINRTFVFLFLTRTALFVLLGLLFWLGWRMRNAGWIGAVE